MITVVGTNRNVFKQVTCRHCASILEYTPSDVKSKAEVDYTGHKDIVKFITCPCGHDVTVRN